MYLQCTENVVVETIKENKNIVPICKALGIDHPI